MRIGPVIFVIQNLSFKELGNNHAKIRRIKSCAEYF